MPNEMTAEEAARRIEDYNRVHYAKEGERAHYITIALNYAASVLRKVAAGELREVVNARWIQLNNTQKHYCNNCGVDFDLYAYCKADFKYCPSCGAVMGKEADNDKP